MPRGGKTRPGGRWGLFMANFTFTPLGVPDMLLVQPRVFGDARGYFMETWRQDAFEAAGISARWVQDNQSASAKGVLRGLHFQRQNTQAKLVRVIRGAVFDVAVDLRPNSPHFGKWAGAVLSGENGHQLYVPRGFAHGFLVLSDTAEFAYKCDDVYNPAEEGGICWNDTDIGVVWPSADAPPLLSDKDSALPGFREQDFTFFERWYTA